MLKVSPRKGVIRFGKRGKLKPWYIGPFKILKRISLVAYTLELPEELSNVHSTFHISNLKKCLSDESLVIPIKELRLDDKLNFVEEPIEILDREVKQLRQSIILIVKVIEIRRTIYGTEWHCVLRAPRAATRPMNLISCNQISFRCYMSNKGVLHSKHMMGNRALLTNFVEKFLGTVRFGDNDFAAISGYEDVVIGSMTIKKVYYVEDLLIGDRSSNLYTISLNEITSNSSACLLAKASSLQSWLWHQRLSHLNFATINNLVKNNLVRGLSKMTFEKDHLWSACEQGKNHRKHHKSKTAFASIKPLYLLHMDLCGPMRVESINGKRYVLVVVDDYSRYTWPVRIDNVTEFKNKALAKFFDEVGISQQFSAARTPQQNGVVV
ncbi:retrovirus-related pol polyprotein from transposon TNT 1-94 [Tanacetum coccineum]